MSDIALSLLALGILAMIAGAWLAWKRGDRKRTLLMAILAMVMAFNIAIWTLPGAETGTLAETTPAETTPAETTLAEQARNAR